MHLGCLWEGSTKILPPSPPSPSLPPPPPPLRVLSHYIHIYIYIYIEFVCAQTLSLFTPQTLHPDILRKQKPQTWHHVFLPTYGRAEADDAQRLKLLIAPIRVLISLLTKSHDPPCTHIEHEHPYSTPIAPLSGSPLTTTVDDTNPALPMIRNIP